jgi:hypothetical protein
MRSAMARDLAMASSPQIPQDGENVLKPQVQACDPLQGI